MDQFRRDLDQMSFEDLAALRLYAEVEINGSSTSTAPAARMLNQSDVFAATPTMLKHKRPSHTFSRTPKYADVDPA